MAHSDSSRETRVGAGTAIGAVVFVILAAALIVTPEIAGFAQVATLVATPVAVIVLAVIAGLLFSPGKPRD